MLTCGVKTAQTWRKEMNNNKQQNCENADGESRQVEQIVSNRFFTLYGIKRKTPNEFTELSDALNNFRDELFKALYIPQIEEWLNSKLKGY